MLPDLGFEPCCCTLEQAARSAAVKKENYAALRSKAAS